MLNKELLTVLCAGLALAGCGGSGTVGSQQAGVRLFNASDGESTIFATYQDASSKNLGYSPDAAYGSITADTFVPGTIVITATIQGLTGPLDTSPGKLLQNGDFYSVYALGGAFQGYRSMIVADSQAVAPTGAIGIRATQLGTRNGSVDVHVQLVAPPPGPSNGLFTDLVYGTVSSSANTASPIDGNGYVFLTTSGLATYTVSITAPGSSLVLASVRTTVVQGSYYSVVVYDSPVGSTTQTSVAVLSDRRAG